MTDFILLHGLEVRVGDQVIALEGNDSNYPEGMIGTVSRLDFESRYAFRIMDDYDTDFDYDEDEYGDPIYCSWDNDEWPSMEDIEKYPKFIPVNQRENVKKGLVV